MAKPISPTPTLTGEDAVAFLEDMKRVERGDLTEEEKEFRVKLRSLDRKVLF